MKRDEIVKFINNYLKSDRIKEKAYNGLSIEGKDDVRKIIGAVSYSLSVANFAVKENADMIITHHSIFFGEIKPITGILKKRIEILLNNNISLCSWHLPLDIHPVIGNNISILKLINFKEIKSFASYNNIDTGIIGISKNRTHIKEIVQILKKEINKDLIVLNYGKEYIEKAGVITGTGGRFFEEAILKGSDLFITGQAEEENFEIAKEYKANLIILAHNKSETYGVRNILKLIKSRFKIKTVFYDSENPF